MKLMGKYFVILIFLFSTGCFSVHAQETARSVMLKKRQAKDSIDVIEKFDRSLAITPEQLRARSKANREKRQQLIRLIEASELSDRQKEKLRNDVLFNPFSKRIRKFVAELRLNPEAKETVVIIE